MVDWILKGVEWIVKKFKEKPNISANQVGRDSIIGNENTKAGINVKSEHQKGGITAGIVNIFHKASMTLLDENKNQLIAFLGDKKSTVHVSLQVGGESGLLVFANEIKHFLIQQGYENVEGVHQIMGFQPFKGVNVEKKSDKEFVIFIGALL